MACTTRRVEPWVAMARYCQILDLPRADAMSRMPETPAAATLDSQADDLEIPAFLRRQAN